VFEPGAVYTPLSVSGIDMVGIGRDGVDACDLQWSVGEDEKAVSYIVGVVGQCVD